MTVFRSIRAGREGLASTGRELRARVSRVMCRVAPLALSWGFGGALGRERDTGAASCCWHPRRHAPWRSRRPLRPAPSQPARRRRRARWPAAPPFKPRCRPPNAAPADVVTRHLHGQRQDPSKAAAMAAVGAAAGAPCPRVAGPRLPHRPHRRASPLPNNPRQYDRRESAPNAAPDDHTLWLWFDADWRKWEEEDPWHWDPEARRRWARDLLTQQVQRAKERRRFEERQERERWVARRGGGDALACRVGGRGAGPGDWWWGQAVLGCPADALASAVPGGRAPAVRCPLSVKPVPN
jgi:hypothetical protein